MPNSEAQIIIRYLDERELTTRQAEPILGVSHTMIGNYRRGASAPNDDTLNTWFVSEHAWVRALALDIDTLRYRQKVSGVMDKLPAPLYA